MDGLALKFLLLHDGGHVGAGNLVGDADGGGRVERAVAVEVIEESDGFVRTVENSGVKRLEHLRCADLVSESRGVVQVREVARTLPIGDGVRAEFYLVALPFIGNQLEGLVPRDLPPLPVAVLGSLDAQHGCLDAVGVVYAIDGRQAFRTDAGLFLFGQFSCRRARYLAIAHMHVQVAAAVAVAAAYAGVNRLFARA